MTRVDRLIEALSLTARHAGEVSVEFFRGMAARMAMSFEKYGAVREAYPAKLDALASMDVRVQRYRDTGNTEYLMDAANFLMIEFMAPRHRNAHFKAEDSAASPGRVDNSGNSIGGASNTSERDNIRLCGSHMKTAGGFYRNEGD